MNNNQLLVTTAMTQYPVIVAIGALDTLPERLAGLGLRGALWLISDSAVYPHYGPALEQQLRAADYTTHSLTIPSGEASKSQEQLWRIFDWMISGNVERRDAVLALGGGVVGDLAGFVAASVLRGIAVVQLPTTLLAMIDAAIGGKTGINHSLGKNLIGAFHQPRMTLADTLTLRTLPPRELRAGWAEAIKHGVIRDAALFSDLERYADDFRDPERGVLHPAFSDLVRRAAAVKVAVVSADEREQGERITLNYGHTLAHALEAATGYGRLLHGEAVAIGMHAAAQIAERLGLFALADVERQRRLIAAYGLPTDFLATIDPDEIMTLMMRDKKVQRKRIRWVLPTAIGSVVVRDDVSEVIVRAVVEEACAPKR